MEIFANKMGLLLCFATFAMTSCLISADSPQEYVVETVILVDKLGREKWEKKTGKIAKDDLETEIQSILYEVNQIFASLDTVDDGIKIRFQLQEIDMVEEDFLPASVGANEIEANYAAEWLSTYIDLYRPKTFDIAILFTGARLYIGSIIKAKGFAKVGRLCTKKSVGIIELTGTFDDVLTTAHELAHIFNVVHDDMSNCTSNGYIMTNGKPFLTSNRYQFSSCSKKAIFDMLEYLKDENCLLKSKTIDVLQAPRYGTLMTADALCKRSFNSLSFVDRKVYADGYDKNDVCLKLACRENTWKWGKREWRTSHIPSPDGLYCGKNKQCYKGACVPTLTGKDSMSDTCPFGDQPVIEGTFPKACGQIQPQDCHKYKDVCCNSCDENNPELSKTADDACRNLEGSKSQMLRAFYNASFYDRGICSRLACLKDPQIIEGKWQYNEYTAPDGMACGKNKRCIEGDCIQAIDGNPMLDASCPFGDQPYLSGKYNKTCDDIVWRSGCKHGWEKICCGSCNGKL